MNVPGNIVYSRDHGNTAILCPPKFNSFRRSYVDNERPTAIMVGPTMLLSVYMPHSGRDEDDYIEALETVRATLTEGRKASAVDFFVGGDINIELKLGSAGEDHSLDSTEWCGLYGPECKGGEEDVITKEKKIRLSQLLKEFNCTATSTTRLGGPEIVGSATKNLIMSPHYDLVPTQG